jgi:transcriptional antiterminator RfaH
MGGPVQRDATLALHGEERWFAVRTQSHREAKAEQQLVNQDFRVFLPRFLKSRRHARKFETIWAPLFPGYLFIILDLTRDRWRSINGTYGVDRLLTRVGAPEPVPHGLVEQLISAARRLDLEEGQTVRVTAGPFADLLGRLATLDDSGRVRVLLNLLGGEVPVVLPERLVMPSSVA